MTPPDATGTTWRRRDGIFTMLATVEEVAGDFVRVRFQRGAQCVIPLGPKTGGPRGYARCEEVET